MQERLESDERLCDREEEIISHFDQVNKRMSCFQHCHVPHSSWELVYDRVDFDTSLLCANDVRTRGNNNMFNNYYERSPAFLIKPTTAPPSYVNNIICSKEKNECCTAQHQIFMNMSKVRMEKYT